MIDDYKPITIADVAKVLNPLKVIIVKIRAVKCNSGLPYIAFSYIY